MKLKIKKTKRSSVKVKRGRIKKIEKAFYRIACNHDINDIVQAVNGRYDAPGRTIDN